MVNHLHLTYGRRFIVQINNCKRLYGTITTLPNGYTLQPIHHSDMKFIEERLETYHWDIPKYTFTAINATYPGSTLGLYNEKTFLGGITAINFENAFSTFGNIFVRDQYRHQGYGALIANTAISILGCNKKKRPAYTSVYLKDALRYSYLGFKESWHIHTYHGFNTTIPSNLNLDVIYNHVSSSNAHLLFNYDKTIYPVNREKYLKEILNHDGEGIIATDMNGSSLGFGILHQLHSGYKIAPIYASSVEIALGVIYNLTAGLKNCDRIVVESPSCNPNVPLLMAEIGFDFKYDILRVHTQEDLVKKTDQVYGITSTMMAVI